MEVIGAGFGRTGTSSLQAALEILGYDPCYHMNVVVAEPGGYDRSEAWAETLEKSDGKRAMELLKGYSASVDFPASSMALELFALNPNAKVVLSVRETFEEWYDSASKTILWSIERPDNPRRDLYRRMLPKWFADYTDSKKVPQTKDEFRYDQASLCCKVQDIFRVSYNAWIEHIKQNIPTKQLLVFKPNDGWSPLCKFLNRPIPTKDYPSKNKRAVFLQNKGHVVKGGD